MKANLLQEQVLKPLDVVLFPSSGNVYHKHVRVGCYSYNDVTQQVHFFRPASARWVGLGAERTKELEGIITELKALALVHSIPIHGAR